MTNQLSLRTIDLPSIKKFGVGFDSMFDELHRAMNGAAEKNYPPYNIIKHTENVYIIEIAVAGFAKEEIDITVEDSMLSVSGKHEGDSIDITSEYLHHGISHRDFRRTFNLAEYVEVVEAIIVNGILKITLERKLPESKLPKHIAIK